MSTFPGVGDPLPDLAMTRADGGAVKPSDFAGRKLVLFFYPKDDTAKHARFTAKHGLTAPLASDAEEGGLSDALGIWREKQNYGRIYMGMVRSTYLVDADGRIARVWSPVKVKGHAAEVVEAAKAL